MSWTAPPTPPDSGTETPGRLAASGTFRLLDVELRVETDDSDFPREFGSVFGGRVADPTPCPARARLVASLTTCLPERPGFGRLEVSGDGLADAAEFLLGFSSPTVPIHRLPSRLPDEAALGIGDDPEPAFLFRGARCLFRLTGRWRRVLAHFLFLRLLRLRDDALFFHAASLTVHGTGVLLVGPKGAGKSTLALALAARGHGFLGDETACYLPASGELLPLRRPVGIKPGPKAARVEEALACRHQGDEDGLVRVEIESLFPVAPVGPVPLGAVVFLRGFAPQPEASRIEPGRDELSQLQPLATTLANRPATHRVFEMIRLLGRVRAYRLLAGSPDDTAILVESVLTDERQ